MTTDGRDTRWAEHRATRRRELVSDALRAIRVHGANVGMDEIAARARTSKTVIYRHFGDRAGLYAAIVESVHAYIHEDMRAALELSEAEDLGRMTADLADAYLALVERDPEIYRFVMTRPLPSATTADPAGPLTDVIGEHIAEAIDRHLRATGQDPSCAQTWGHGITGFIRATADWWMAQDPRPPRAEVIAHITRLFTPAFPGALHPPATL